MTKAAPASQASEPTAFTHDFLKNLGFVVNKVGERINAQIESVIAPLGLNVRQYGLLLLLQDEGSQSQIVISQRVGLDRTSVMRTVDLLEGRGLVRRDPDPTDRRKHSVVLTEAGAELLTHSLTKVRQAERKVTAVLSEQEQAQLLLLLKRMLEFSEHP